MDKNEAKISWIRVTIHLGLMMLFGACEEVIMQWSHGIEPWSREQVGTSMC